MRPGAAITVLLLMSQAWAQEADLRLQRSTVAGLQNHARKEIDRLAPGASVGKLTEAALGRWERSDWLGLWFGHEIGFFQNTSAMGLVELPFQPNDPFRSFDRSRMQVNSVARARYDAMLESPERWLVLASPEEYLSALDNTLARTRPQSMPAARPANHDLAPRVALPVLTRREIRVQDGVACERLDFRASLHDVEADGSLRAPYRVTAAAFYRCIRR